MTFVMNCFCNNFRNVVNTKANKSDSNRTDHNTTHQYISELSEERTPDAVLNDNEDLYYVTPAVIPGTVDGGSNDINVQRNVSYQQTVPHLSSANNDYNNVYIPIL